MATLNVIYGSGSTYIDVTQLTCENFHRQGKFYIPALDVSRAAVYGDPLPGIVKNVIITISDKVHVCEHGKSEIIDVSTVDSQQYPMKEKQLPLDNKDAWKNIINHEERLRKIHEILSFEGGNIRDEYPEQLLAASYIQKDATVLELGSNLGRNTLTIAAHLDDDSRFVTVECDPTSAAVLTSNRDINGGKFKIEDAAISSRKLYQSGWNTVPSDTPISGYKEVKTITWQDFRKKYGLEFDTIVADCEGALYYIIKDAPEILNGIKLLIVENDYLKVEEKEFVDNKLKENGLKVVYSQGGGWGHFTNNFYEVWAV